MYNNYSINQYVDKYHNTISTTNKNYNNKVSMTESQVPVNRNEGFVEIFIFTERGRYGIPGAVVTIYVRQENDSVPVYNYSTDGYPVTLRLPVAHPLGELIRGPEYYFTTYDIQVNAAGFAPYRINNVRLFEGITYKIDADMQEIIPGQYPIPEVIINIPPHLRDEI